MHKKRIREVAPELNRPAEPVRKAEERSNGGGDSFDYPNDIDNGGGDDVEDKLTFAGMSVEILGRHSVPS